MRLIWLQILILSVLENKTKGVCSNKTNENMIPTIWENKTWFVKFVKWVKIWTWRNFLSLKVDHTIHTLTAQILTIWNCGQQNLQRVAEIIRQYSELPRNAKWVDVLHKNGYCSKATGLFMADINQLQGKTGCSQQSRRLGPLKNVMWQNIL